MVMYPLFYFFKAAVSIQRILEYIQNTIFEKPLGGNETPENWPHEGRISISKMSIRYRKGLPLVLKDIDMEIKPGEKVAIIGRTGSGKSTSLLAFMRILEMANDENKLPLGNMKIDGIDIGKIGLHSLRKNIAIIPQDPFLIEGSLRSNVDPFEVHDDRDIVEALNSVSFLDTIKKDDIINQRIAELKQKKKKVLKKMDKKKKKELLKNFKNEDDFISSTIRVEEDPEIRRIKEQGVTLKDKLSLKIEQKGNNLSIGQRQLVCIARALIKKPKILLMDEATANIDQKTDSIIQGLIKGIEGSTVVTIAHRLITIVQYDKIFIFNSGEKVEEGSPKDLLDDEGSRFTKLVKESGLEFFDKMKLAAGDMSIDPAELFAN